MKTPTSIELNLRTTISSSGIARNNKREKASINKDATDDDDSSIETIENDEDEVVFAVGLETTQYQPPSNLSHYKEITTFKSCLDVGVIDNPRFVWYKSLVAEMCGLNVKVYSFGPTEQQRNSHKNPLSVNKIATFLSFDPHSGLYNHIIRGKAYVVLDDAKTRLSRSQVWALQEMISEHKDRYHEYGADFSRRGHNDLMKACVRWKKGKWIPRSIYDIAIANSNTTREPFAWPERSEDQPGPEHQSAKGIEFEEAKSASPWFETLYTIEDGMGH